MSPVRNAFVRYSRSAMSEAELAVFVLVGFLLPVPILVWLDRPVNRSRTP
jgi:hypothetical protein